MGSVGDNDSDDTHLHSFYMVELTYSPHTLQENIFIYGKIIHFGEFYTYLISDISHLIWYVNTIYYKTKIIISLKNVIQSDITKIKSVNQWGRTNVIIMEGRRFPTRSFGVPAWTVGCRIACGPRWS